ncbi:hypothetical protein [Chryseobacterium sp. 3008163]|uniref:hypothetical protein n=1 Tax=Chryseobacterium sp. 3008163 TaxID=2478663 RepID=UPI000F0CE966|nr:hypothetical protein [Chryseobacterium sp. 3008163]AYN00605.1 hypothetical protein EAG08_10025 [Chryseobacterium sp. 3008163]
MNKIILSITLFCAISVNAQVAIGKENVANPSVSLEFATTENRGFILPYVEDNSGISQNGTIIYDTADHKVKYLKGGSWFDLSVDTTGNADLSLQATKTEKTGAKVSIGTPTSTDGILVLEDNNKAMVLPKVASPHLNIINPSAGMMVYDTTARQLAVFNGTVWSFWKP